MVSWAAHAHPKPKRVFLDVRRWCGWVPLFPDNTPKLEFRLSVHLLLDPLEDFAAMYGVRLYVHGHGLTFTFISHHKH